MFMFRCHVSIHQRFQTFGLLHRLPTLCSKYKLMETNLDKVKQTMKEKVPEIERSLVLVRHLQERQVTVDRSHASSVTAIELCST